MRRVSLRSHTASRGGWSIPSTRAPACSAAWRCPTSCSAVITRPSHSGARNNPRHAAEEIISHSLMEEIMKNKLMALVEEAAVKKEVPDFNIGDQVDVHQRI